MSAGPTWHGPDTSPAAILAAVQGIRHPVHVVRDGWHGALGVAPVGSDAGSPGADGTVRWPIVGTLPPMWPEWLGDRSFLETHGLRFPYVAGAMANGIATTRLVIAMARAGMLGFFGAAGLTRDRVEAAIDELSATLDPHGLAWGSNLIHSPGEPALEESVAELYLHRGVRRVSASAYMELTRAIVRYAATGLAEQGGRIVRRHHVFAKISRPEVARRFLSPPPDALLEALVARGELTADEARLARRLPVAEDFTVESDSGGHTDNRPLLALFPTIRAERDQAMARHGYDRPIRLGAAGGLGTPASVAAAFALGASYVLTGSVNQAAVESGLSEEGRRMLATAGIADVAMAPAADMFELGVEVQVLQRGTMFAPRAHRLYELYRAHEGLHDLPDAVVAELERTFFHQDLDKVWADTAAFFQRRDPHEVERAEQDPKHKMALVFRSYLGRSSRWAIDGEAGRRVDYQIWCGPAMGAFNAWTTGSFLEPPESRSVVQIALNLLEGAAVTTRAQQLRTFGVGVPDAAFDYRPRPLQETA